MGGIPRQSGHSSSGTTHMATVGSRSPWSSAIVTATRTRSMVEASRTERPMSSTQYSQNWSFGWTRTRRLRRRSFSNELFQKSLGVQVLRDGASSHRGLKALFTRPITGERFTDVLSWRQSSRWPHLQRCAIGNGPLPPRTANQAGRLSHSIVKYQTDVTWTRPTLITLAAAAGHGSCLVVAWIPAGYPSRNTAESGLRSDDPSAARSRLFGSERNQPSGVAFSIPCDREVRSSVAVNGSAGRWGGTGSRRDLIRGLRPLSSVRAQPDLHGSS